MKDEARGHTPIIDAATTILVTDTEILATMAHGGAPDAIVALKEVEKGNLELEEERKKLDVLLESHVENDIESDSTRRFLGEMDGLLPDEFDTVPVESGPVTDEDVFISIPNMNKKIHVQESTERFDLSQQSSTSSDPICRQIHMGSGRWAQIMELKTGFIFESTK
jgi:hypothetical protein